MKWSLRWIACVRGVFRSTQHEQCTVQSNDELANWIMRDKLPPVFSELRSKSGHTIQISPLRHAQKDSYE